MLVTSAGIIDLARRTCFYERPGILSGMVSVIRVVMSMVASISSLYSRRPDDWTSSRGVAYDESPVETRVSITSSGAAPIANTCPGVAGWSPSTVLVEDRLDGFGAACTTFFGVDSGADTCAQALYEIRAALAMRRTHEKFTRS